MERTVLATRKPSGWRLKLVFIIAFGLVGAVILIGTLIEPEQTTAGYIAGIIGGLIFALSSIYFVISIIALRRYPKNLIEIDKENVYLAPRPKQRKAIPISQVIEAIFDFELIGARTRQRNGLNGQTRHGKITFILMDGTRIKQRNIANLEDVQKAFQKTKLRKSNLEKAWIAKYGHSEE